LTRGRPSGIRSWPTSRLAFFRDEITSVVQLLEDIGLELAIVGADRLDDLVTLPMRSRLDEVRDLRRMQLRNSWSSTYSGSPRRTIRSSTLPCRSPPESRNAPPTTNER
jgi:hypothetical protein